MLRLSLPWIWRHPLARRQRLRAYRRYTTWQIRSRLSRQPLVISWVNDARLVLQPGMTGATGNWYCGLHEWADMAFLLHLLRPEDTFVDVGSNVGSYTVLAAAAIGAKTVAVEPAPNALAGLQANLAINGIQDRCRVLQACLGAKPGRVNFSIDRGPMNTVVPPTYAGEIQQVPVQRLDDLSEAGQACCWKLDVEGFEREVLQGASRLLAQPSLHVVFLEDRSRDVVQIMQSAGFQSCSYDPWTRTLITDQNSQGGNQIWIRDPAWVVQRLRTAAPFQVFGLKI